MSTSRLFHISEEPNISEFIPRPSPSFFEDISGDVVFAISERFVHNYYFPRNCPRVIYYANEHTTHADKEKFIGNSEKSHFLFTEDKWRDTIQHTKLYCYEFATENFVLLDACAGYYVTYKKVQALAIRCIENPYNEIMQQNNISLRFMPEIVSLAEEVKNSTLGFSLIRMRFALL